MTKSQKTTWIVMAASAVLLLIVGKLIAQRMLNYLKSLDNQIQQAQNELHTATDEITNNTEYVEKWQQINGFKDEPVERRQTDFTEYLDYLEMERSFFFDELTPSGGKIMEENPQFQILSYSATFSSNLEDLVEFLDRLDNSEKLLKVNKLEISKRKVPYYRGSRFESALPSTRDKDLNINITISIPAAAPPKEETTKPATP